MEEIIVFWVGVALLTAVVVAGRTIRERRKIKVTAAPELEYVENDAINIVARPMCKVCGMTATEPTPTIVHARPAMDWLWRLVSVVPAVTFQLKISDKEAPKALCNLHFYRSRSLLESRVGEIPAAYSKWVDQQTQGMIAFQASGMWERMLEDELPEKKRTKRQVAADRQLASVSQIQPQKLTNGNGA